MDPKFHIAAAYTNHYDPDQTPDVEVKEDPISMATKLFTTH